MEHTVDDDIEDFTANVDDIHGTSSRRLVIGDIDELVENDEGEHRRKESAETSCPRSHSGNDDRRR